MGEKTHKKGLMFYGTERKGTKTPIREGAVPVLRKEPGRVPGDQHPGRKDPEPLRGMPGGTVRVLPAGTPTAAGGGHPDTKADPGGTGPPGHRARGSEKDPECGGQQPS